MIARRWTWIGPHIAQVRLGRQRRLSGAGPGLAPAAISPLETPRQRVPESTGGPVDTSGASPVEDHEASCIQPRLGGVGVRPRRKKRSPRPKPKSNRKSGEDRLRLDKGLTVKSDP